MDDLPLSAPRLAEQIRVAIIEQSKRAHVGHIGSALSIADLVAALFAGGLRGARTDPERDRFVLSKGHACLAVYGALWATGVISERELDTFCADGSTLGSHPEHALPGIDFSTVSPGHGLSLAAGP